MQWILVDCEHGNISDSEMHSMVGAIATVGEQKCSPIVRIAAPEPWMIKRSVDQPGWTKGGELDGR